MRKIYLLLILLFVAEKISAQKHVMGHVYEIINDKKESLPGVNIFVAETTTATQTESDGMFMMDIPQSAPVKLVASFVGYISDTITVNTLPAFTLEFNLKKSITLKTVDVKSKRESTSISTITPINTTLITKQELLKAACCNLSESFETNPTVDINFTDAVTGAKQIQMLGLDGIYSQIQAENVPLIHGLSSSYGLSFTPGPWIESIQINKGVGSVINGYESITGQLNIELKKPQTAERFFINGYENNEGRSELNLQLANRFNDKVSTELLLQGSNNTKKVDGNNDGFLDQPLTKQLNAYNRWHFSVPNKLEGQIGIRALYEKRQGGQTGFNYDDDFGKTNFYGVGITNKLFEVFTKTGTINVAKPYKSFALITSSRFHQQDEYFGLKTYNGDQRSFYANTIYQTIIKDTRHYLRSGISFNYNFYKEEFNKSNTYTNEIVPGAYTEYTYNDLKQFALVAGVRADYHNDFGLFVTPRLHLKYNFTQVTSLRLSTGTGWRTAHIYAENSGIFASSRTLVAANNLKPEQAWNSGINFTHKFRMFKRDATFNTDYYYTQFINQVVVDMEDAHTISFYNLLGKSYAHYIQAEVDFEPLQNLSLRLAYKHAEVYTTYSNKLLQKPLSPKDKGLVNLQYKTENKKWSFDVTAKLYGINRIPSTGIINNGYEIPASSQAYTLYNSQITYSLKSFDVYLGAENISDYRQSNAIIAANEPFGNSFDASLIWGPLMGRTVYVGFRYSIK